MKRFVFATLLASVMIHAQRPAFEVVSVKPSPANCAGPGPNNGPNPGRLDLPCVPIRALIRAAYGLLAGDQIAARSMQIIGGPSWLDNDRFDISAKASGPAPATQMMGPMMQSLLEDRFQLKVHVEARESPVYALTAPKGAAKLTAAKPENCVPLDLNNRELWAGRGARPCGIPQTVGRASGITTLSVDGATMEEFAGRVLPSYAGRTVIDKTGITGRFDLRLEFTRDLSASPIQLNGVPQPAPPAADPTGPSIFTALQDQLGLKLSPDKAPVNVLVIDSIQKPAEN
jgi:uncharacterized protein (TIGR03435 family)